MDNLTRAKIKTLEARKQEIDAEIYALEQNDIKVRQSQGEVVCENHTSTCDGKGEYCISNWDGPVTVSRW